MRYRCLRWTVARFAFPSRHVRALGRDPNLTSTYTALPAKRTCQETSRALVGCFAGRRRRVTRRQRAFVPTTGKSPNAISTFPGGTDGYPSCPAASAGSRKLPKSTQAAGGQHPGPTEPNQPRSARMQRAGPQWPRLANERAELVSTTPRTHAKPTTMNRLIGTQAITAETASPVLQNAVASLVTFPHTGPGDLPGAVTQSH